MNVFGIIFECYLAKILSFKSGNLLYKSNLYLLSEGTVHPIALSGSLTLFSAALISFLLVMTCLKGFYIKAKLNLMYL